MARVAIADRNPAAQYDPIAQLYDGYPGNYLEDVVFFAEEARAAGSPVLELGVGTGRLALCLASIGLDVVGLDCSAPMLRVLARKRAAHPELPGRVWAVAADMRRFSLRRRFPLAIAPFRAFLYLLTREDQRRALGAIRRHLSPDGRLILAFFVPPRQLLALGRTEEMEAVRFADGHGDEVVARDWAEFDVRRRRVISHLTYVWPATGRRLEHTMEMRYLFPQETRELLEGCGYRVVAAYGGFAREPLQEGSREQIWVAEPAR